MGNLPPEVTDLPAGPPGVSALLPEGTAPEGADLPATAAEVIAHLVEENASDHVHAHAIVSQYGDRLSQEERDQLADFLHARFPVPGGGSL